MTFQVGFLLEGAEEQLVVAGEHPPIDPRQIIAGDVLAELVELDGGPALVRAVAAGEVALDHGLRAELIVLESADVGGIEEAGHKKDRRLRDRRQKTRGRDERNSRVFGRLEGRDLKRGDAKGAEGEEVIG